MARADAARRRHEDHLLSFPNVTGVGTEVDPRSGAETIVVYVTRKVPATALRPGEALPAHVDDVPVRVAEIGEIRAHGPA